MIKIVTSVMIVLIISTVSGNAMYAFADRAQPSFTPQQFDPVCPSDCADLALQKVYQVDPYCLEVEFDSLCDAELAFYLAECLATADASLCVGGELLPIDTTALLVAGAQANSVWILSALAVIGSVAFGTLYLTTRRI